MGTITDLVARVIGDISSFSNAMRSGSNDTAAFAQSWTKAGSDVATAASRMTTVIGSMVGGVTAYTAKMGVAFNSLKEDSLADFTVMLQSAEKARDMLSSITTFAAKTPLESGDIMIAAKTLLQYGVAGDSVMPMLKKLGDTAGGNAERFKSMALAYGQASSNGRLLGNDVLQMVNAGFNPLNEIAKRTGESMEVVKERMSKGGVSITEVNQAFTDATSAGGMFFGLMQTKSATMSGLWSSMMDNIKITAGKIFEPLSAGLKDTLEKAVAGFDGGSFDSTIFRLQEGVESIVRSLMELANTNGPAVVKSIADGFLFLADGTVKLTYYLNQNGAAIMSTGSSFLALLKPIATFLANHPQLLAALIALKVTGMLGVNQALLSVGAALLRTIPMLAGFGSAAGTAATAATGVASASSGMVAGFAALGPLAIPALLVAIGIAATALALEMSGVNKELRDAAANTAKMDSLTSERRSVERQRDREAVDDAESPAEKKRVLQEKLTEAKEHAEALQKQANAQPAFVAPSSVAANYANTLKDTLVKGAILPIAPALAPGIAKAVPDIQQANPEKAELSKLAAEKATHARKLQEDLLKIERQEKAEELKADIKADAERMELDVAHFEKLNEMRDLISKPGTSDNKIQKFASKVDGATPELAGQFMGELAASDKSKKAVEDLTLKFMQLATSAQKVSDAGAAGSGGGPGGGSRKEIDKALAKHRNDAKDAEFKGAHYDQVRDFMGMGKNVTGKDVGEFAGNMKGVSPQLAAELARLYDESNKSAESLDDLAVRFSGAVKAEADYAKRVDKARDAVENMNERLTDLHGSIPEDQLKGFHDSFNKVQQAFVEGRIDADGYRDSLKNLNARMTDAGKASSATQGLHEDLTQQAKDLQKHDFGANNVKGLTGSTAAGADKKFQAIDAEGKKLADAFQAGTISSAKFTQELARLKTATTEVTEASIKEETEKRKQALMRGDFQGAGLNFQAAVNDKIASQNMQLFDQAVTEFVDQFVPLSQMTQSVSQEFSSLTDGMGKFGQSLEKGTKDASGGDKAGGSGGQDQAAQSFWVSFLNSVAGKIEAMQQLIQFDKQALTEILDPQRRQQLIDEMHQLTRNIAKLNNSVSTFSGNRSNDPIFRDPGITGGGSQTSVTLHAHFPNVQDLTPATLDMLSNALANHISMQGRGTFGR